MYHELIAANIRRLREREGMTQAELAAVLCVSDKAVSKWETGRGLPDIGLIEPLAAALRISVAELFSGESISNRNRAGNMKRSCFYICPLCGNVLHSIGEAAVSCCGVTLPRLETEEADAEHAICAEYTDGQYHVTIPHVMCKTHYISFIACISDRSCDLVKLYPEESAEAWFSPRGRSTILLYCSRHGLMQLKISPRRRPGDN